MSDYTKTTWANGGAPAINATNLNKMETGIDTAHSELADHITAYSAKVDQDVRSGATPTLSADNFSDGGGNAIITTTQETNFGTAYTHANGSTGADHTWLDQTLVIGSSPDFHYYRTIFIPAAAMTPPTTSGAGTDQVEFATNDVNRDCLLFDGGTLEKAQFSWPMPEDWDAGTIKAKFPWSGSSGCSNGDGVVFGLKGGAVADSGAIDRALGTAQEVADTLDAGVEGDHNLSAATSAITLNGTPAAGKYADFEVYRDPTDGSDTMAEDAKLWGVWIQYQTTVVPSAW